MRNHTYKVFFKEFLKLFKFLASNGIYIFKFGSPLQSCSPREKEKKLENSHKACRGTLICGRSLSIYRYLVCRIFIKTLIIMSISIKIYRPFVSDPFGPYISLVNNSIDPITLY